MDTTKKTTIDHLADSAASIALAAVAAIQNHDFKDAKKLLDAAHYNIDLAAGIPAAKKPVAGKAAPVKESPARQKTIIDGAA